MAAFTAIGLVVVVMLCIAGTVVTVERLFGG